MTNSKTNPDITVRGGLINVPLPTKSIQGDRHQPNTPINKKTVKPKADHQPYKPDAAPPITKPKTTPADPPDPPTPEPEGVSDNVTAPPSQSD